ncbi:hypothetical protein LA080_013969 [Diaporthe eres]|nr:hypothetical protein LA080_013969 [Diaporthe eres]
MASSVISSPGWLALDPVNYRNSRNDQPVIRIDPIRRGHLRDSTRDPQTRSYPRKLPCESDERAQNVLINREYLLYLEETGASLKQNQGANQPPREAIIHGGGPPRAGSIAGTAEGEPDDSFALAPTYGSISQEDSEAPEWNALTNPLSTGQSMFVTSARGRKHYLGVSSNWSFTRRILSMTYEYVHQNEVPVGG